MKKIFIFIFLLTTSLSFANDGEYRCNSVQNVDFRNLSTTVLSISYHIDKVKELENNGLRSSALNIVREGMNKIERLRNKYKDSNFCYSLAKRAEYQLSLLTKYQIELSLLNNNLQKYNDCTYAILKLEEENILINKTNNSFYEKFIATSKTVTKAELIRRDKSCNDIQRDKVTEIIRKQNIKLSNIQNNYNRS